MLALPTLSAPLTDGVVSLRQWEVADAPAMQRIFCDPEMLRWTDADDDDPLSEYEQSIRRGWKRREAGDRIPLAILDPDGAVVGAIDLMQGEFERGEIGYAVGSWARRQGYATRAVRLLGAWAFDVVGVLRLELPIPVGNAASQGVAERSGYTREGLLRSYLWLREAGERHDVIMYARLPGDSLGA